MFRVAAQSVHMDRVRLADCRGCCATNLSEMAHAQFRLSSNLIRLASHACMHIACCTEHIKQRKTNRTNNGINAKHGVVIDSARSAHV